VSEQASVIQHLNSLTDQSHKMSFI